MMHIEEMHNDVARSSQNQADPTHDPDGEVASLGTFTLTSTDGPELEEYPDWSPDGKRIAYTVANSSIWVMDADGTNKRRVTEDHFFTAGSQWRPVGSGTKYTQE